MTESSTIEKNVFGLLKGQGCPRGTKIVMPQGLSSQIDSRPSTPVLKRAKRESLAKKANSPARNSSQSTISSGTSGGRPSTPSGGRQTKTAQKAQAVTTRSGRRSGIRK